MGIGYNRKSGYVFGGASSFWFVFVAMGLSIWLSPLYVEQEHSLARTLLTGLIPLLLGFFLRFTYYGTQIDYDKKKIKAYTAVLGYKTGDWNALPHFKKLRFTSNSINSRNTPNGISPTLRHTGIVYSIALFSNAATPDYVIKTENKAEALQDAKVLSDMLQLKIEEGVRS